MLTAGKNGGAYIPLGGMLDGASVALCASDISRIGDEIFVSVHHQTFVDTGCARCGNKIYLHDVGFHSAAGGRLGPREGSIVLCDDCATHRYIQYVRAGGAIYVMSPGFFGNAKLYSIDIANSTWQWVHTDELCGCTSLMRSSPGGAVFCLDAYGHKINVIRADLPVASCTELSAFGRDARGFARDLNTVCVYGGVWETSAFLYDLRAPRDHALAFNQILAKSKEACRSGSAAFASEHIIIAATYGCLYARHDDHAVIDIRAPTQPIGQYPFDDFTVGIV